MTPGRRGRRIRCEGNRLASDEDRDVVLHRLSVSHRWDEERSGLLMHRYGMCCKFIVGRLELARTGRERDGAFGAGYGYGWG